MKQTGKGCSALLYYTTKQVPTSCRECPCCYISEGAMSDECQILGREFNQKVGEGAPTRYLIPAWCPLKFILVKDENPTQFEIEGRTRLDDKLDEEKYKMYLDQQKKPKPNPEFDNLDSSNDDEKDIHVGKTILDILWTCTIYSFASVGIYNFIIRLINGETTSFEVIKPAFVGLGVMLAIACRSAFKKTKK